MARRFLSASPKAGEVVLGERRGTHSEAPPVLAIRECHPHGHGSAQKARCGRRFPISSLLAGQRGLETGLASEGTYITAGNLFTSEPHSDQPFPARIDKDQF